MKIGNLNSLHIGLLALLVVAVVVAGVSYSRQMKAERQVAVMANAINSGASIEELKAMSYDFVAYSGAGTSASAAKWNAEMSCYVGERGSDKGQCIETRGNYDNVGSTFWSNFIFW